MESEFKPPWPEWNDQFINDIKWRSSSIEDLFSDPINHGAIPHKLPVAKWLRPVDLYEDTVEVWKVGDEEETFDLISNNRHLLHSKIMRRIMTSIMCLEKIGRQNPITGKNHQPNTPGTPDWKPWHHIYSRGKIGKGQPSSPKYNPQGMYYIRLFYMDKWRRITVDDFLPYDEFGNLQLPNSNIKTDLWLPILSKALLRIASLTWTKERDIIDFSVVTCLTGWIEYNIDCRSISIDKIWNAIRLNLIEKPKKIKKNDEFCLTSDTMTCLNNKNDHEGESCSNGIVFGVLDNTTKEIKDVSPAVEHMIYFCYALKQPVNSLEDLPKWKNLRWVNWAIENKILNAKPGSYLRIIGMFSPFSRVIHLRHTKESQQITGSGDNLVPDSIFGEKNLFDLMLEIHSQVPVNEHNNQIIEDTLEFNFAEIYPYLRELKIYYRCQDFHESISTNDIENFVDGMIEKPNLTLQSQVKLSNKKGPKTNKHRTERGGNRSKLMDNEHETEHSKHETDSPLPFETCRFFYLYSDTPFCKNIYFTISIVQESGMEFGYLICEKYNWKSVAFGPLLLGVKTVGTVTSLLQLGPGMQVCRVFYSLPSKYNLIINSGTYFTIINVNKLHELLSNYTKPLIIQGDKMLKGFKQFLSITPTTSDHIQVISNYTKTLYPPGYKEFPMTLQIKLAQDFEEVFDKAFTKFIFDSSLPMLTKVALLNDLKVIFNNQKFGEPFIDNLDKRMIKDIKKFRKDLALGITPSKIIPKIKTLNEFYKNKNMELIDISELVDNKEASVLEHFDMNEILYLNAETHIEVLRNILDKKPQYLQFYPFMNDHYLLLKYKNYEGITEVTPAHNWFIIARLTLNIHSTKAVPCGIYVITEFPKAVLYVVDSDSCEKLSLPPGMSATFHLKRNKVGYTILLCGYATPDMVSEELSIAWRIRVLGVDSGNTLHRCESINPYYCQERGSFETSLCAQNITGYYIPNTENIIGRFIITTSKSLLATLYLSVSNEEAEISLTLKGINEEIIIKAEGKGSLFVPIVLLDLNYGVSSPGNEESHLFFGYIHLMSPWILTSTELSFVKVMRSSSKKDIISLRALYEGLAAETVDVGRKEVSGEKINEERSSNSKSGLSYLGSENLSNESQAADLGPADSNYSYCGYDSSHTESKGSSCQSGTTSSCPQSGANSITGTSTSQECIHDTNMEKTGTVSNESSSILECSLNSSSERNDKKKIFLRVVEDPYGLFGAGPHWVLSFIIDSQFEEYAFVDNDYIRYEEFQKMKEYWEEQNPKSLEKGKCLRNNFLSFYKNDFLKYQLDPENISISDFSEDENLASNELNSHESSNFNSTSSIHQTYPVLLLSSDSSASLCKENSSKLNSYLEKKTNNCFGKHDGLPNLDKKNSKNKKVVQLESKLSPKKLTVKSSSSYVVDSKNPKKLQDLPIYKVLAKTKRKLENILYQDESSSSLSTDNKNEEGFNMKFPPLPTMTNVLMKHYSVPFKGRPTLLKVTPNTIETEPLKEEDLRKICSKEKVSFPKVYKKLIAPILWSVSNKKMPHCLKDLPVQAYSQKRFRNKLETILKAIQLERNKEMLNRETLGAKQRLSGISNRNVLTA